jgi:hypothetical protein
LAASISRFSRSEIDAMTNSLRSGENQPDPIEPIESARESGQVEPAGFESASSVTNGGLLQV